MTGRRKLSNSLLSGATPIERAYPMVPRFQAEPIAARSIFVASFANVTPLDTDDGLVLADAGSFLLAERTRAALRTAIAAPPTPRSGPRPRRSLLRRRALRA